MKKENRIFLVAVIFSLIFVICIKHDGVQKVSLFIPLILLVLQIVGNVIIKIKGIINICCGGLCALLSSVAIVGIIKQSRNGDYSVYAGVSIAFCIFLCALILFGIRIVKDDEERVFLIMFAGFLLRAFYVILVQAHYFQNDAGILQPDDYGHLGYIYYLFAENRLPEVYTYQFYHPPLHHMISAIFMKAATMVGISVYVVDELLQYVSLFYTIATYGFLNKIGIKIGIGPKARIAGLGLAMFMPYGIMMSGLLNNDNLMILLVTMFIYYLICWYETPTFKNIICMAFCIGGAMMTKFSAALIAPAAAVVMLYKAVKEKSSLFQYIKQFAVFALISFPIGLWHTIRNVVKFGLKLGYVPNVGDDSLQFIGMYSVWERFFDFSGQFDRLCLQMSNQEPNVSHNIPVSMVKYAVFGEGSYHLQNPVVHFLGVVMFWMTALAFVLLLIGTVLWICKRKEWSVWKLFVVLSSGTLLFSYFKFCIEYPHICTMSIRYIIPVFLLGFMACGAGFINEERSKQKVTNCGMFAYMSVYVIGCCLLILNLGFML